MKGKKSHWVVLRGEPLTTATTRKRIRVAVKLLRNDCLLRTDEFLYIGKCIRQKNGHTYLILEA